MIITSLIFILLENGPMIRLKMEVFLSQLDILRCGKGSFALVKIGFALANLFAATKDGFAMVNQKVIFCMYLLLHCSESFASQWRTRGFYFAFFSFATTKLFLRLGELLHSSEHTPSPRRVFQTVGGSSCFNFCPFLCLIFF